MHGKSPSPDQDVSRSPSDLIRALGLSEAEIAERKRFLEFSADTTRRLRRLHDTVSTGRQRFVETFYHHLSGFPETSGLIADAAVRERLRATMDRYFDGLTAGLHDTDYVEERVRIGAVHQRIGLDVKWFIGAYRKFLAEVTRVILAGGGRPDDEAALDLDAVLKAVFFDIGLVLDTYFLAGQERFLAAEAELRKQNQFDPLTGMWNRLHFNQRLNETIAAADPARDRFAVLLVDIDHFKNIVDGIGHVAGDRLLKEAAQLIARQVRAVDIVARLGADQFAVLAPQFSDDRDIHAAAHGLRQTLSRAYRLGGAELHVTCSIGASLYPRDGVEADVLLRNASAAVHHAKAGGGGVEFFQGEIQDRLTSRLTLESQLHQAFDRRELFLAYQPQIDLRSRRIVGLEALVRWRRTDGMTVPPDQFVPVAEDTGLVVPMGQWVLDTALAQVKQWHAQAGEPIRVAVNVSARQFRHHDFVSSVERSLAETGFPPHLLELEITESVVVHDPQNVIRLLGALRRIGVRVALDDFGTGYSSLSCLKQFPIDVLKIDQSFVRGIGADGHDCAITRTIAGLGHSLGLRLVAEGVETEEQEIFLTGIDCHEAQGFRFHRPLPPAAAEELLVSQRLQYGDESVR